MAIRVGDLVDQFRLVYRERMRDLPIVNSRLDVEAVGFDRWEGQDLGVLITPWFMNLVLLPEDGDLGEQAQGDLVACRFPSGVCEMTVCHDGSLGTNLAAVLFRTVAEPWNAAAQDSPRERRRESLRWWRCPRSRRPTRSAAATRRGR